MYRPNAAMAVRGRYAMAARRCRSESAGARCNLASRHDGLHRADGGGSWGRGPTSGPSGHHLPATAEERAVSVALLRQLAALIRPDAPGSVSIRSMEVLLKLPRYTLTRLTPEKAPRRMSERVRLALVGEIGRRTPRTKKGEK